MIPAAYPSPLREAPGVQANTWRLGSVQLLLRAVAAALVALAAATLMALAAATLMASAALGATALGAACAAAHATRSNALLQSLELEI